MLELKVGPFELNVSLFELLVGQVSQFEPRVCPLESLAGPFEPLLGPNEPQLGPFKTQVDPFELCDIHTLDIDTPASLFVCLIRIQSNIFNSIKKNKMPYMSPPQIPAPFSH